MMASVAGTIRDSVAAAGIIIGGAWAYFKFARGQTFERRVAVHIDAKSVAPTNENDTLWVEVSVENVGLSRFDIRRLPSGTALTEEPEELSRIEIRYLASTEWSAQTIPEWRSAPNPFTPLFAFDESVQSGEQITDEMLIPLPRRADIADPVAYAVTAYVRRPIGTWERRWGWIVAYLRHPLHIPQTIHIRAVGWHDTTIVLSEQTNTRSAHVREDVLPDAAENSDTD